MKTASHSGDIGDIIYALPVMRELGPVKLYITNRSNTRQNLLHDDKWSVLQKLLEAQSYIDEVIQDNSVKADYDFDKFRPLFFTAMKRDYVRAKFVNLTSWQCIPFAVNPSCQEKAWIEVEPNPVSKYVFNRSPRYHNPDFPWQLVYDAFAKDAVFLGLPEEYTDFVNNFGPLPFLETPDLFDAARIIKGSEWFFGNQSCLNAIAEAMKHNSVQEVWMRNPNCLFGRPNVRHGVNFETTKKAIEEIKQ